MTTSAGDLLDTVAALARRRAAGRQSSESACDAALAMGHLGRALSELRRAGVASTVGNEREQLVAEIAASCAQIAQRAPLRETMLCHTAAAAADALALAGLHTTVAGRWAMTTEVIDAVIVLNDIVVDSAAGPEITERCISVRDCAVRLQQDAALNVPTAQHFAVLDDPIPRLDTALVSDAADVVRESTAQMLYASEQRDTSLTLAQVLARSIAAQALTHAVESRYGGSPTEDGHAGAGESWSAARAALAPFDDGSRRPQRTTDPGTAAALRLHAALQRAGHVNTWDARMRASADASVQLLPPMARQLERTLYRCAEQGSLLAYACDLPNGDGRPHAFLAGHTTAGLIRVSEVGDVEPAAAALRRAGLLTAVVAEHASSNTNADERFPRRLAASHQARIAQQSSQDIGAAQRRAYDQLKATRAAPRRSR